MPTQVKLRTLAVTESCKRGLLQVKFVSDWLASYAMHEADAIVLVNVMRIPCFGRRMTIGRASITWPGAS
jgi:hypothetical protein